MDNERLNRIYDKTDGYCHICHKKLSFSNYGIFGAKCNWEIEHSVAKANAGSNNLNNLFPACISCNRIKREQQTKIARSYFGNSRAPYSRKKKQSIKNQNTVAGTVIGGIVGSVFGPIGTFVGAGISAGIGAAIGNESSPKR